MSTIDEKVMHHAAVVSALAAMHDIALKQAAGSYGATAKHYNDVALRIEHYLAPEAEALFSAIERRECSPREG